MGRHSPESAWPNVTIKPRRVYYCPRCIGGSSLARCLCPQTNVTVGSPGDPEPANLDAA